MSFLTKNDNIRGRWYLFFVIIIIFCDILKIPLTSILLYKLLLLFICLFNAYAFEVSCNKNLIVYCLLESSMFWNLIDRRKPGICVSAVLKRLCAIFYPCFIQNSSNFDTNIIETWHNIYLRFPKVKDMFKICLIFGYFHFHDFSLSSFLKQMQNWINIKLNTILRRY